MHVEQPLDVSWAEDAKFSAGASFVRTTRAHEENQFGFESTNQNLLNTVGGDLNAYFSQENFVVNLRTDGLLSTVCSLTWSTPTTPT